MHDWKKIVREKLVGLPLKNRQEEEVIEELAQQLEAAYEEALAKGMGEKEALSFSLAQFSDWEKLRSEVFQSVEGTQLPIWEQHSIFAPRRLPVWIALALTLALLALPTFRQALAILPVPGGHAMPWDSKIFSDKALRGLGRSGDKRKFARTLAFVALHSPDDLQAVGAAETAIVLDPQLTWISAHFSHAFYLMPGYDPHPWVERLKSWDSQNAYPYLLEAAANVHSTWESRWTKYNAATPDLRRALAAEPAWRVPMEKAFAAPRLELYGWQQFALDRQVLEEQGLDRPDMLAVASWSQSLPNFMAIKCFADFQLKDVGKNAENAGRPEEALAAYWSVAHFGERMQVDSSDVMQLFSVMLREDSYVRMISLLRREGRTAEAVAIESALRTLPARDPRQWPERVSVRASGARSARLVLIAAVFQVVFGIATVVWFISVLTLKWRPSISRGLNRLASALCLAPSLFFIACLTLLLGYYPYALSIGQISSKGDFNERYMPFLMALYAVGNYNASTDIWLKGMFWPSIWCAAVALLGAVALRWAARRERPDRPGVA